MKVERFAVDGMAGERWPGGEPTVVLLHEGVADQRGWREVAGLLAPELAVRTYDRRGYGETPVHHESFRHVDDLLTVIGDQRVWLVGASAGGGIALDAAIIAPERVAGLVLIASAVSGSPDLELDPDTQRFDKAIDEAIAARDAEERNRLETWLWLDGPAQPEGRVGGAARELALDMNAIIIRNGDREDAGEAGVDAWGRLGDIRVPVTTACGEYDLPFLMWLMRQVADRVQDGRFVFIPGVAHQPYLEQPEFVGRLIRDAVRG